MKIWLVFYTRAEAENDEELFLSAHATQASAKAAAEADAADQDKEGFRWGDPARQPFPNVPDIYCNHEDQQADIDDGSYILYEVELHGAPPEVCT